MESDPRQPLLRAALRAKQWFNVGQIRLMLSSVGILPKSVGTKKREFVEALVNSVCSDLSDDEKTKIIAALAGEEETRHNDPLELIKAVSCLDPKEQDAFEGIIDQCVRELELQHAEEVAKLKPEKDDLRKEKMFDQEQKDKAEKKKAAEESVKFETTSETKAGSENKDKKASLKHSMGPATEEVPLAKVRAGVHGERKPRALGKSRTSTPQCLKDLMPPIESVYLSWMPENRMIMVDFQGGGLNWIKFQVQIQSVLLEHC